MSAFSARWPQRRRCRRWLTAELFGVLQAKDIPSAETLLAGAAEPFRSALLALPGLWPGCAQPRQPMPAGAAEIRQALADMQAVADSGRPRHGEL